MGTVVIVADANWPDTRPPPAWTWEMEKSIDDKMKVKRSEMSWLMIINHSLTIILHARTSRAHDQSLAINESSLPLATINHNSIVNYESSSVFVYLPLL